MVAVADLSLEVASGQVTVLLGPPPELSFDHEEQLALDVLAQSGLVPPLRMVTPMAGPEVESA